MKYEEIKTGMHVTNGKITGSVTQVQPIGTHKPIVVSVRTEGKFGTMNFWPADLEPIDEEK